MPNFIWMCSLCRLPVAENDNFWQMLTFGGLLYRPHLVDGVKFGVLKQTERLHLHAKFNLNVFILSASGGQSTQFWANFDCWGASRSVYSIALWRRKTPIFAIFGLRHLVISTVGGNLRKLNTGAQLQTFPYPTASKSFVFSNAFMAKSGEQTMTFKSVTYRQSVTAKKHDRQTKISTFFRHPGGGWNPRHIKLGMVIDDLEHVLAPLKRLGVWRIVSVNLGVTRPRQIKIPITP